MPYKDKETRRESDRKYHQDNRERRNAIHREYMRRYREANGDKIEEYGRKYREANRDKINEHGREYHNANRDRIKDRKREYRESKLNHIIYIIELPDSRLYVGSTHHLDQRLALHRLHSIRFPDRLLYRAINATGGWNQAKVHVLMRNIPDYDLRLRLEQHFIDMVPEALSLNTLNAVQKAS